MTITYINKRTRHGFKIDLNRLVKSLLQATLIIALSALIADFVRFPDKYISTWKYQLHQEIKSGDQQAINYYNKYYLLKGVYLYGEN